MMNILKRREIEFLQKFSAILEDYNAVFFFNLNGGINIEFYLDGEGGDESLGTPITLPETFDETDINKLFKELEQDLKVIEEERSQGLYKGLYVDVLKETNGL